MNFAYRDLKIWKECELLTAEISACTKSFPEQEVEGLGTLLRSEARLILSHMADGFQQDKVRERATYFTKSRKALYEVEAQVLLSTQLDVIPKIESDNVCAQIQFCKKLLSSFIAHYSRL